MKDFSRAQKKGKDIGFQTPCAVGFVKGGKMKCGKKGKGFGIVFKKLEKRLDDQKFVARILRNVQLKEQQRTLVAKISKLKEMLKTAKGRQKAKIENDINGLEKAREIGKRAFFER